MRQSEASGRGWEKDSIFVRDAPGTEWMEDDQKGRKASDSIPLLALRVIDWDLISFPHILYIATGHIVRKNVRALVRNILSKK